MTPANSAVIASRPAQDGKPGIVYRYAGDRAVLVEYGEMVFDLTLNFFMLAVDAALRASPPAGMVETAPGFRSILVVYDPALLRPSELVEHLHGVHDSLQGEQGMTIPSRLVHMPLAFDDSTSRDAVERYVHTIRKDAPNAEGGTNIDYIVRYNGFAGREALYEAVLGSEQWTAFVGFFPGLPFMFPLDPRETVFVPKYNPTRTWTSEGAVGIGGPCCRDLSGRVGRRVPAVRTDAADLRHPTAQRRVPRQPAAPPRRRPGPVPPGRRGGVAAGVRGRPRRSLPLPDRGQPVRRRRIPGVAANDRRGGGGATRATRGCGGRDARAMRSIEVLEGGIQTTVQDYPGRRGMQAQGFFPAGPMDHFALRAANLLVGNPSSSAGLEITLGNFRFRLDGEATMAICGAETEVTVDGESVALWESHRVPAGAEVAVGLAPGPGFRCYLAVDGGFDVPLLLGSRATYTMGALGGLDGRALQAGDRLPLGEPGGDGSGARRRFRTSARPEYSRAWEVRAMRGPQAAPDFLTENDMATLFGRPWPIDRNSNRTGVRLESYKFEWARESGGIAGGHPSNILDNSYPVGAINVNGDLPVILGPDGPTAGGFLVAAAVIHADFWKIGQFRPVGDTVRFREVTIEEAVAAERELDAILTAASLEAV